MSMCRNTDTIKFLFLLVYYTFKIFLSKLAIFSNRLYDHTIKYKTVVYLKLKHKVLFTNEQKLKESKRNMFYGILQHTQHSVEQNKTILD